MDGGLSDVKCTVGGPLSVGITIWKRAASTPTKYEAKLTSRCSKCCPLDRRVVLVRIRVEGKEIGKASVVVASPTGSRW